MRGDYYEPMNTDSINCALCGGVRVIVSETPDHIRKELKAFVSATFLTGLNLKWYFCATCNEYTLVTNPGSSSST